MRRYSSWIYIALVVLGVLGFGQPNLQALPQRLGDLNEDTEINVLDLVRLVAHLRGTQPLNADLVIYADVNLDGAVNQIDVQLLADFILGNQPLPGVPLSRVRDSSPLNGARDVSVNRETVFRFTLPLAPNTTIATDRLTATFGGRKILSRVEISSDRKTVTLFYLEPLPGGSRIRVAFNGNGLFDFIGREIDIDGDGTPGGTLNVDFDTLATGGVKGTIVTGRVFASELAASAGATNALVNKPLQGVTVTVDGMEESLRAVTDAQGNFRLDPAPAGNFFVHIDGRTATNGLPNGGFPRGPYYPYVGKEWESKVGEEVNIGSIYLPLINEGTLQAVSTINDTPVTFAPSVIQEHPELLGVTLTVPANSLFSENGTRGGKVGIAPVAPDRLPGPLPAGLKFPIVITVQTDGGANFDRPAPVCFPNLPDPVTGKTLAPGAKSALWSFNHDTGNWEIVGPMTVSDDGKTVCTDQGVGIIAPGWHGSSPLTPVTGGNTRNGNPRQPPRPRPTGPQECAHDDCPCSGSCNTARAVYLQNGEEIVQRTDLVIPGRAGMDFIMDRTYRSQLDFNGPVGFGWTYRYNEGLFFEPNGDVVRYNGRSHEAVWKLSGNGSYVAPPGYFSILTKQADGTFLLTERDGFQRVYRDDGRLICHQDRFGNRMLFDYNDEGDLKRVIDVFGREIQFTFQKSADGVTRLAMIEDFLGRQVSYKYDNKGNLISVTTPVVTKTSTGNDFPAGRTEMYTYSDGFADAALNHNILSITSPEDVAKGRGPRLVWTYGNDRNDPTTFDHVMSEMEGGTNDSGVAAGGTMRIEYESLNAGIPAGQPDLPRGKARVFERNGNIKEYFANEKLMHIATREFTRGLRAGEPEFYETKSYFDADGQLVRRVLPAGNEIRYVYQTGGSRRNQSNLKEIRRVADAGRGGGPDIVTSFTYEPLFNQIASITEPRGNDSTFQPPFGQGSAARYTKKFFYDYQESNTPVPLAQLFNVDLSFVPRGLGDLNGDARTDQFFGNLVRVEAPPVQLRNGSFENKRLGSTTQPIVSQTQWNDRGQVTAQIDPEGNVTDFVYYPEDDPDGDSETTFSVYMALSSDPTGYLKSVAVDNRASGRRNKDEPPPLSITTTYLRDQVGNVKGVIDPRGVLTSIELNPLNEVVTVTRGADVVAAISSGQLITGEPPLKYRTRYIYDANGRVIRTDVENKDGSQTDLPEFIQHKFVYDILDHLVQRTSPVSPTVSLISKFAYDENEQLIKSIQPEGNSSEIKYDGRNLLLSITRGAGSANASTVLVDYDPNGNRLRVTNPVDNDGDGKPGVTVYQYDGFDRLVAMTDPLGNQRQTFFDPASNPVRKVSRGRLAGGVAPVVLEDASMLYDEVGRLIQKDEKLFLAQGFQTTRPPQFLDQNSDGMVTTQMEYDALSRPTYFVEDDGESRQNRYDGAGRVIEVIDATGNRVATDYDQNSNPIRIRNTEVSPENLVQAQSSSVTQVFDQLDRVVRASDNAGQTVRLAYDSRNNLISRTDPEAPLTTDPLKLFAAGVNSPGNSTTFFYDGANRLLASAMDVRVGGTGLGPLDTSNLFNPDGQVVRRWEWDGNSRLRSVQDDNGKKTAYAYDELDRKISQTYADGKAYTFTYNGNDDLVQIVDPTGTVIRQKFDELDRLLSAEVTTFGPAIIGTKVQTYEYDGLSRLTRTTDDNGDAASAQNFERVYDSLSRVIEERQNGQSISSIYAGDGKRVSVTYPGGRKIDSAFDALDRIRSLTDPKGKIADFHWIGLGHRQLSRVNGNGTMETVLNNAGNQDIGYDALRRLNKQRVLAPDGTTALLDREYSYNRMNQRVSERRLDDAGQTDRYTYDSLYRVVRSEFDRDGQAGSAARGTARNDYAYDGAGNRRVVTETFTSTQPPSITQWSVNDLNEYLAAGQMALAYSANGNIVDDGLRTYAYDYHNRLVAVRQKANDALVARYLYDSLGRRREKTVYNPAAPGQVVARTRYLYDRWQVCEEQNDTSATLATFVYSPAYIDQVVQMERTSTHPLGAGSFYFHQNARADVIAVTSANGNVVEKRYYDDFGHVFAENKAPAGGSTIGNPFGFQGQRFDPETGLYYFRHRYYDPDLGRFLQRDPISDPVNLGNQYTLAGNGPVSGLDPYGLQSQSRGGSPRSQTRPPPPPPPDGPPLADDPVINGMSVVRGANQLAGMYGYSDAAKEVMSAKSAFDAWRVADQEAHFANNMVQAVGGSLSQNISIATKATVKADQLEKALVASSHTAATSGQASRVTAAKAAAGVGAALQVAEVAANAVDYYNKDERVKQMSSSERDRILAEYDHLVREAMQMSNQCQKEKLLTAIRENMEFQLNNVTDSQVTEHLINAAVFLRDSLATFVPGPISRLWGGDAQK